MKRPGLLVATLATSFLAVFAVRAAGWFNTHADARPSARAALTDAERWYRSNQPKHWHSCMVQPR